MVIRMNNTIATTYPKIDIHTHIVPGIDDGIKNITEFNDVLNQIINNGVRQIVCTPHFNSIVDDNNFIDKFNSIQELLSNSGIKSHLGFEFLLNYNNISILKEQLFKNGKISNYLLVEFARNEEMNKNNANNLINEIMDMGYKVVLAHPEFYINYHDINFIKYLKDNDVIIQCDASSLIKNKTDKKIYKFAQKLLKNGLIDIIASDCHDTSCRNYDNLNTCYKYIREKYGIGYANLLFYDNPKYLIDNFIK